MIVHLYLHKNRSHQPRNKAKPLQYHGMMKWSFKDTMEINFTVKAGDKNATKIVFGGGNKRSDKESWFYLTEFIRLGDDVKKAPYQTQFSKVEKVVKKLWAAGTEVFGHLSLLWNQSIDRNASTVRSGRQVRARVFSHHLSPRGRRTSRGICLVGIYRGVMVKLSVQYRQADLRLIIKLVNVISASTVLGFSCVTYLVHV